MKVGRFLVHVYHGGEDIAPADLLFHKGRRLSEIGLYLLLVPTCEELRAGGDEGVHEHGAVLAGLTPRRLDAAVNFLTVFLRGLDNVKIVLASALVNVGIAGVLFLCPLVVGFQRPGWPRLVLGEAQNCVLCFLCHKTSCVEK